MALARILSPIDQNSVSCFACALSIALANRSRLYLMHVEPGARAKTPLSPDVRDRLLQWGRVGADEDPGAIEGRLGIQVSKGAIPGSTFAAGVSRFAAIHHSELVILPSYRRGPLARLAPGVGGQDISRAIMKPTLFVPDRTGGFIDPSTGRSSLERVLVPLDGGMTSAIIFNRIVTLVRTLARAPIVDILCVGDLSTRKREEMASRFNTSIIMRKGPLVDTIIATAIETGAGLIAIPSFGQRDLMDSVRGTVVERILSESELPVLAIPLR